MAAVTETRQYLASVKRDPANHNGATEDRLAQFWTRAAIDMTAVDGESAIRYLKSWLPPELQRPQRQFQLFESVVDVLRPPCPELDPGQGIDRGTTDKVNRSEEHTSELQSLRH